MASNEVFCFAATPTVHQHHTNTQATKKLTEVPLNPVNK